MLPLDLIHIYFQTIRRFSHFLSKYKSEEICNWGAEKALGGFLEQLCILGRWWEGLPRNLLSTHRETQKGNNWPVTKNWPGLRTTEEINHDIGEGASAASFKILSQAAHWTQGNRNRWLKDSGCICNFFHVPATCDCKSFQWEISTCKKQNTNLWVESS